MKRVANCKATFHSDIKKVWELVTTPEKYAWRSDLAAVEEFGSDQFTEISRDGYMTDFTITNSEHLKRWEVTVENDTMIGHRVGTFTEKDGVTEMELQDDIEPKFLLGRLFCKAILVGRQAQFVTDLNKALTTPAGELPKGRRK